MSEANFEEQKKRITDILSTMFTFLGLNGEFRLESKPNNRIGVKISSDDVGRIIGRRGQTLESLQLILNRIVGRDDKEFPLVLLDIDGYAEGERAPRKEGEEGESPESNRPARGGFRRRERGDRDDSSQVRLSSKEQLERQALDAAKEVKRWGDPIKLPEMNAHDRRIIHLALKEDPEVMTESEGEGTMRQVVISLKKQEQE
ncbi:MAG: KH domain-containing protein [Lentisphaerae bacterium]|jgi:spoIIIJ-associated protein|nr:KH domain-containing protein [Lentisphaerota bacterium]